MLRILNQHYRINRELYSLLALVSHRFIESPPANSDTRGGRTLKRMAVQPFLKMVKESRKGGFTVLKEEVLAASLKVPRP